MQSNIASILRGSVVCVVLGAFVGCPPPQSTPPSNVTTPETSGDVEGSETSNGDRGAESSETSATEVDVSAALDRGDDADDASENEGGGLHATLPGTGSAEAGPMRVQAGKGETGRVGDV